MTLIVFNAVCSVIAWTFIFLVCRAEKRAEVGERLRPGHGAESSSRVTRG